MLPSKARPTTNGRFTVCCNCDPAYQSGGSSPSWGAERGDHGAAHERLLSQVRGSCHAAPPSDRSSPFPPALQRSGRNDVSTKIGWQNSAVGAAEPFQAAVTDRKSWLRDRSGQFILSASLATPPVAMGVAGGRSGAGRCRSRSRSGSDDTVDIATCKRLGRVRVRVVSESAQSPIFMMPV